ncbi:MAG: hypothetical protein KDA75_13235 [Planctomycetaceae bacterium]|nr:hypothetical protein [Planctomycetaceae bacterium]
MFRVTHQNMLQFHQTDSTRQNAEILRLQAQISSGVRIQRPSDDPAGEALVLRQRDLVQRLETKVGGIERIRARVTTAYQSVLNAQQLFVRAKTIALDGRQTTDPDAREVLAREVDGLLAQLQTLANTTANGESIFGGANFDGEPFRFAVDGTPSHYVGSEQFGVGHIDGELAAVTHLSGNQVFQQILRSAPVFTGDTGAAAGSGTSSARGTRELQVTQLTTGFAGGSGVQSGLSAAADTILGPVGVNSLAIRDTSGTGAGGVVSLNGGPEIAFTSADTDLAVAGPRGEVVHLDMTAITAGFDGTIDLSTTGTLSIDGGATTVAIDYSANQAVIDSRDGSVLYVDSTAIHRSGASRIDLAGTADAFAVLAQLRDELRNSPGLSNGDRDAALSRRLDDIDRISNHLLSVVGEQSITLERLDGVQARTEQFLLDARSRLSEVEETDFPQAILELQSQQLRLQFSLATAAKMFDVSVLNFLG